MKKLFINILVLFLVCMLSLQAQDKEKVRLKLVQTTDGEIVEIDTIIIEGHPGTYYYRIDGKSHSVKLDSLVKQLKYTGDKDFKFVTLGGNEEGEVKHIWVQAFDGSGSDSILTKRIEVICGDSLHKSVKCKEELIILHSDSLKCVKRIKTKGTSHAFVFLSDGEVHGVGHDRSKDVHVWDMFDGDLDTCKTKRGVYIYSTGDDHFNILKHGGQEKVVISEVIVSEPDDGKKVMKIYIDKGEEGTEVKIEELEEALKGKNENVIIEKYKTKDGKTVIKAEYSSNEEDQEKEGKEKKRKRK